MTAPPSSPRLPPMAPRMPSPDPPGLPGMPGFDAMGDPRAAVYERLLARRTIVVDRRLGIPGATYVAAQLLTLDADSDGFITLLVNSPGEPLDAAAAILDTMELVRGYVDTTCLGQAVGSAGRRRWRPAPAASGLGPGHGSRCACRRWAIRPGVPPRRRGGALQAAPRPGPRPAGGGYRLQPADGGPRPRPRPQPSPPPRPWRPAW